MKDYQRVHYQRNRAEILERKRQRYAANKEAEAAKVAARRSADPEKARAYARAYHAKNKSKLNDHRKKWRTLNPEKAKQSAAQYRSKHPEAAWQRDGMRRARAAGAPIGNARLMREWRAAWMKKPLVLCFWCKKEFAPAKCHADHMEPLSSGGVHSVENLCISCALCNTTKGSRTLEQWTATIAPAGHVSATQEAAV